MFSVLLGKNLSMEEGDHVECVFYILGNCQTVL